jgi:hypothetical protein
MRFPAIRLRWPPGANRFGLGRVQNRCHWYNFALGVGRGIRPIIESQVMGGARLSARSHSITAELRGTSVIAGASEGKLNCAHHNKLTRMCRGPNRDRGYGRDAQGGAVLRQNDTLPQCMASVMTRAGAWQRPTPLQPHLARQGEPAQGTSRDIGGIDALQRIGLAT